ncbi:hypothetical protein R5R35_005347 [Gryllus longicercus]|uniref:SCP domain-containing protein n=1 Tax=Gryllus longicercus TaxID=2509291 RepID=A0AAN9VH28_9ORTH
MCVYPEKGPGKLCKHYSKRSLDDEEKKLILHYQNYFRNKVALGYAENEYGQQPPAAGMLQLMWHDELQEIAQRWADQCTSFEDPGQHDVCKVTKDFEVGQNIITIGTQRARAMNHSEAIKDWYLEMTTYDPDWVGSYQGSVKPPSRIGHYTQLVWAKTQYVGCASVTFVDVVRKKRFWVNRLVCNYGPSGNIIDASVYKVGRPCSKCPPGTSCHPQWGGLCATPQQLAEPPVLPVDFLEPADWVKKKYSEASRNDDVSIRSFPLLNLTNRKRPILKSTALTTTNEISFCTISQSISLLPTMSLTETSLTSSTTLQSSSLTTSLTSAHTPAIQSYPLTTKPTHTNSPWSAPTKRQPYSFRRPATGEERHRWTAKDNASTSSSCAPKHFRRRAVLQKRRRRRWRWRTPVCLCPMEEDEEAVDRVLRWKAVRSRAASSAPRAALALCLLPALTCVL